MEAVEEFERESFSLNPEHFLHSVKFRRSIRNYREKPVEKEKLERILEAGRYTPTAKNRQGTRFIVLEKELETFKNLLWDEVPELADRMKETAPPYAMLFKFMYRRRRKDPKDDPLFFNVENMAVAEGAGVLYSGYLQRIIEACPALKEWLGIPETSVACCMLLGYPAVTYRRTAPRKKADIEWR